MKRGITLCSLGLAVSCTVPFLWHAASRAVGREASPAAAPASGHLGRARSNPAGLPDRIRHALASTDPADRAAVFSHLLADLVRTDPQAAARLAETNDIAGTRELIPPRVAQLGAARPPAAALGWPATLTAPAAREALVTDVCLELATRDPAGAIRTLGEHTSGEHPHGGLDAIAERWAGQDLPAARAWALSRPGGGQRDRLIARLAFLQAQDSPREAAALAANEIPEGETQAEAVIAVLHQWATRDPAAAAAWVRLFPDGELKSRADAELTGISRIVSEPER